MTTIHYVGIREGSEKWGQARCSSHSVGKAVTSDTTKVTCSRCAKILGIAAAPKPESKNVKGTCACCFSSQKTQTSGAKSNGRLFHHGFERPGNGYIEGACPGHDFLPYEKSCEGTKYVLGFAQDGLRNIEARIEHLKTTNEVSKLVVICKERVPGTFERKEKSVLVTLVKDEAPTSMDSYYGYITLSFDEERAFQMDAAKMTKHRIEMDIKFYEKKIAEWKAV